jgi:dsDNA-binding SOS-regulon protein
MKQFLTSQPVLVESDPVETLFLYLAATTEVISMVLVTERSKQLLQGPPCSLLWGMEVRPPPV